MEKGRRVEEERRRGRTEEALKHSLAQAQVVKPSVAVLGQVCQTGKEGQAQEVGQLISVCLGTVFSLSILDPGAAVTRTCCAHQSHPRQGSDIQSVGLIIPNEGQPGNCGQFREDVVIIIPVGGHSNQCCCFGQ